MVLLEYFLRVTRALSLPCLCLFFSMVWLCGLDRSKPPVSVRDRPFSSLLHCPDFPQSGTFLLTGVYLWNHWFVAIMGLQSHILCEFYWAILAQAYLATRLVLQAMYTFATFKAKEPPDPTALFPEGEETADNHEYSSCFDTKVPILDPVSSVDSDLDEDNAPTKAKEEVPSIPSLVIDRNSILEQLHEPTALASNVKQNQEDSYAFHWDSQSEIRPRRKVHCQALMNSQLWCNNAGPQFDLHSRSFVLDSGSSDHLCRDKELYVGEIRPIPGVTLQGVGGQVSAKGYGTIKFQVFDDNGRQHTFVVHNVIYVPDAPMNLLSPQKWIAGMTKSERLARGAMTIVMDDVTLLLWGKRRFLKTIHHRPGIGLPLLAINESLDSDKACQGIPYPICQPCYPVYMQTSKIDDTPAIIEDDDGHAPELSNVTQSEGDGPHVIPREDNEPTITSLDSVDPVPLNELIADDQDRPAINNAPSKEDLNQDILGIAEKPPSKDTEAELLKAIRRTLSKDEQEMMTLHHKLKHISEKDMHKLARAGTIPAKFQKMRLPPCPACILGKQHRRPWRSRGRKQRHIRKPTHRKAGDGTSVDQLESRHPGLVPQTKGFHRTTARFVGGTIFVDHATGFTYVHLMKDFTAEATLEAKHAYEAKAAEHGVHIRSYHGDNGRFAETAWVTDSSEKGQTLTFCGVGSHFQNGIAEKRIRDLTEFARTLLIHGNQIWPEGVKLALWPYALKEAERIFNELRIGTDDLTPVQRFTKVKMAIDLKQEHPMFCPVYALDGALQGGGKLPRWNPRSRAGVYLGRSKHHASNVALILNLETGNVSPQYHLTFDDTFSTVEYLRKREVPPFWMDLVRTQSEFYDSSCDADPASGSTSPALLRELRDAFLDNLESPHDIPDPRDTVPPTGEASEGDGPHQSRTDASDSSPEVDCRGEKPPPSRASKFRKVRFVDEVDKAGHGPANAVPSEGARASEGYTSPSEGVGNPKRDSSTSGNDQGDPLSMDYYDSDQAGYRRSSRHRLAPDRLGFLSSTFGRTFAALSVFLSLHTSVVHSYSLLKKQTSSEIPGLDSPSHVKKMFYQQMTNLNCDGTINYINPTILNVQADNESYMFHEILQMDDRQEFIKAMVKELEDHHHRGHWSVVRRNQIGKAKTIKTIWSFKRKRRPDGSIIKHKARLCAHGGMQVHGDTFWDTYAPVVNWASVRLMLIFSEIHKLHTRSIDFTLAFPQADVKVDIYMELPIGCSPSDGAGKDEYVLKLIKNLYGLKDAGRTWFEHLKQGLETMGFKASEVDPCIFYMKDCVILVYVDDCLIFTNNKTTADKLIQDLMELYSLTDEGELGIAGETVSSYLGVQVTYDKVTGEISLTQPFLIQRILDLLGDSVKEANVKQTPAEYKSPLHKDLDGPERKQKWNYRSAIGMLNYLAASTRPDILCAVHSAARFSANPKLIHEQAIKRICRYLKGTTDKGIILKPDASRGVDCYVDASFATEYDKSRALDPSCVLSRTGYAILYKGCPVIWVSKMQTEIALSTTEAEYIALSQAMRDVIPFVNLLSELQDFYSDDMSKPQILCRLFEDNNGTLLMAKEQKYRPRTKHIALKYHHFRSFVNEKKVQILPIDTKEQLADQFTKALDVQTFVRLRSKLMGW
jgi:hypothetical protein